MTNGWQGTPRLIPKQRFLAHSDVRGAFGESFILRSDPGHILQLLVRFFYPLWGTVSQERPDSCHTRLRYRTPSAFVLFLGI